MVPASAHLAAEAAALAEKIGEPGIAHVRWPALELALAHEVRNIMPRHVEHSAGPHGETECGQRAIDVLRQRAFLHQAIGLPQIGIEHPVGAEAIADPHDDTDLADRARERHRGRKHRGIGLDAANDFKKPHDMRRTKEMQPDDVLRPRRHCRDRIDIERRGVAGEDGAGLGDLVELRKDAAFDRHVFEHGFDNQISVAQGRRGGAIR